MLVVSGRNGEREEGRCRLLISVICFAAFVWGGDAVYADLKRNGDHFPAEPERLLEVYQRQLNVSEYQKFISQGKTIIGVQDDHDFVSASCWLAQYLALSNHASVILTVDLNSRSGLSTINLERFVPSTGDQQR